jgi:hypothetical protein
LSETSLTATVETTTTLILTPSLALPQILLLAFRWIAKSIYETEIYTSQQNAEKYQLEHLMEDIQQTVSLVQKVYKPPVVVYFKIIYLFVTYFPKIDLNV